MFAETSLHSANVHAAAFAIAPLRVVRKTDLSSIWSLGDQMEVPVLSFASFVVLAGPFETVPKTVFSTAFSFEAL